MSSFKFASNRILEKYPTYSSKYGANEVHSRTALKKNRSKVERFEVENQSTKKWFTMSNIKSAIILGLILTVLYIVLTLPVMFEYTGNFAEKIGIHDLVDGEGIAASLPVKAVLAHALVFFVVSTSIVMSRKTF